MKSLNVEKHPNKTWLGRVKNGIDFLGFRITPTAIQPSTVSVSRRDKKVARLYEQGASKKRIGQYLRRWLGWSLLAATGPVTAAPGQAMTDYARGCDVTDLTGSALIVTPFTSGGRGSRGPDRLILTSPTRFTGRGNFSYPSIYGYITFTDFAPTTRTLTPSSSTDVTNEPVLAAGETRQVYVSTGSTPTSETCTYVYTLTNNAGTYSRTLPQVYTRLAPAQGNGATGVPIFSPIGLVVMAGGLLWFGRRRKALKLSQD